MKISASITTTLGSRQPNTYPSMLRLLFQKTVIGSTTFARYGYFGLYERRFQQRSVASGRFDQPHRYRLSQPSRMTKSAIKRPSAFFVGSIFGRTMAFAQRYKRQYQ